MYDQGRENMSYASRVKAGAEFLDSMEPGWHNRIDVDSFSIVSTTRCILGQLFMSFMDAEAVLVEYGEGVDIHEDFSDTPSREWLDGHGFDLTVEEYTYGASHKHIKWIELRWTQEINKRKNV